ncbi:MULTISPECIES: hypothetical protein [Aerosakkonema]|uniref:hypothetical protein n=1 Tax=Aerosakkonema TaxID=1246629 RepID=UPI0035BB8900
MAASILTVSYEDGSVLTLRERKSGGFFIYYEDSEGESSKLVGLAEDIDINLAKSIFFMVADRWGWERFEDEEEEDEEEEDEEL